MNKPINLTKHRLSVLTIHGNVIAIGAHEQCTRYAKENNIVHYKVTYIGE